MQKNFYYCGFNAFGQVFKCTEPFLDKFTLCPITGVKDAVFSWSYLIICTADAGIRIFGFVDGKANKSKELQVDGTQFLQVSCCTFRQHILLVSSGGECWQYSANQLKKLINFTNTEAVAETSEEQDKERVVKVCCGENVNLALSSLGRVYTIPSPMFLAGIIVTDVACGFEHCLLLTADGTVYSWGAGSRGQLGHGCLDDQPEPRELAMPCGVTRISAGGWHCAVITNRGQLWTWGWNNVGQLGFPPASKCRGDDGVNIATEPLHVPCKFAILDVACGDRHTVALSDGNKVWACGWNAYGQLGKPSDKWPYITTLTELQVPDGHITKVLAGAWSTAILVES